MSRTLPVAVIALFAAAQAGCSSNTGPGPDGAGGPATGSGSSSGQGGAPSSSTATTGAGEPYPACNQVALEPPPGVPADWQPFTCFGTEPGCALWVAPPTSMPEPIQWVPCEGHPHAELDCRIMGVDWEHGELPPFLPGFELTTIGGTNLFYGRRHDDGVSETIERVLASIDGVSRLAYRRSTPSGSAVCHMSSAGVYAARVALAAFRYDVNDALLVLVDQNEGPALLYRDPERDAGRLLSSTTIDRMIDTHTIFDLATMTPVRINDGAPPIGFRATFEDVFFYSAAGAHRSLWAVGKDVPPRALRAWPGDASRGAGNFGTDGTDMVWTEGRDRPEGAVSYPTRVVSTAPYTTDPGDLRVRELGPDPNPSLGGQGQAWAVGCGYAAHPAESGVETFIVRLTDGASWTLRRNDLVWRWGRALGITCDELFVSVSVQQGPERTATPNVARVRLDSLGPAEPPR